MSGIKEKVEALAETGSPPTAARCPRHVRRAADEGKSKSPPRRITWRELHEEPFRLFFPAAVLAGLVGVLLWPLMLAGWMANYPGEQHARLMVNGFFGGFIFGFLATSMPRLLEVKAFSARETLATWSLYLASVLGYGFGMTSVGDGLFVATLLAVGVSLMRRFPRRKDLPPPGFVLIPLAFGCVIAGMILQSFARREDLAPEWDLLGRLLAYHAFVLLCILGAGGFLLPRFLGLGVREKFAASQSPQPEWLGAAARAGTIGTLLAGTYVLEAFWSPVLAVLLRVSLICGYLWKVMPLERLRWSWKGVQWLLLGGLVCVPLGVLAAGLWPGWRVGLSHIELLGGFGLITLGVATRVVFGHSGQRPKLERFHPAITTAAGLMVAGMLTRITGDLVPSTMQSHYLYGALCWAGGLILWAVAVLPGVLIPDDEA